ncbi:bifunctional heptose 7-phosphate kinase/heptose 1-phosphate adenyltransferase [Persicitalea sp.]|uniref:bifunctional heptose 7-phosphate kinase/heptose 1-phosphate adenyltransferase n=1 Tax=Persicitalea sp. TaxID=3100273 RepID=UPI003593BD7B
MAPPELDQIFKKIKTLRVGVIGDFAVDLYFDLHKNTGEISLETGQEVWWGSRPRTSLGGAGNVAQNLLALGVESVKVFGAIGNDLYGREMLHLMQVLRANTDGFRIQEEGWDTCVYTKPLRGTSEQNRIDFGTDNRLSDDAYKGVLRSLKSQMAHLDVLIINQQFPAPLITEERVARLNHLIALHPFVFVLADMRTFGLALRGVTLKVNTEELARLLKVQDHESWTSDDCTEYGKRLAEIIEGPVLITHGEDGMHYITQSTTHHSPAQKLLGDLDPVGAGDTAVAAFAASAGAKIPIQEALKLANLAAAVTVQKHHQTGTATPQEITELANKPLLV